jgi:hypothetical protein
MRTATTETTIDRRERRGILIEALLEEFQGRRCPHVTLLVSVFAPNPSADGADLRCGLSRAEGSAEGSRGRQPPEGGPIVDRASKRRHIRRLSSRQQRAASPRLWKFRFAHRGLTPLATLCRPLGPGFQPLNNPATSACRHDGDGETTGVLKLIPLFHEEPTGSNGKHHNGDCQDVSSSDFSVNSVGSVVNCRLRK